MTRKPRVRTHQLEREDREDKLIRLARERNIKSVGTVVPGAMERIYGKLAEVRVRLRRDWDSYTIEWKSLQGTRGTILTIMRKCVAYDPYSLEWDHHVEAGIIYISVYDE
ncbi:hypothetical protein ACA1_067710 [Medusavirus stheno T3]|uniref:Uncharacterized protein n=1 Tax=Medusavirus stheno T3 TaxID=3069717 RepID=A0A7S8BD47_9VIRU|nr:hypothetical protein ACA1_067710 [Acanthamoeba castellanii medusavirus]QPB44469.1 hypothetical protein ACA1_067710 [Medusavirus stheno T3]